MDFSYYKYLIYINKEGLTTEEYLQRAFNLTYKDAEDIISTLLQNGYIKNSKNVYYYPTYKGKHFFKSFICKWFFNNLFAIIAIIISIIALFK